VQIFLLFFYLHSQLPYNAGFFPSGVRAWFVNHSLQLIFQVPTAVWTYTLSSLIIHYNADSQGKAGLFSNEEALFITHI
jgi:hypothetical protein